MQAEAVLFTTPRAIALATLALALEGPRGGCATHVIVPERHAVRVDAGLCEAGVLLPPAATTDHALAAMMHTVLASTERFDWLEGNPCEAGAVEAEAAETTTFPV